MKVSRKKIKTYSISRYLTTSLIITVIFVSTLSIFAIYHEAKIDAKKHLESKADEIIDYLDNALVLPLWNMNDEVVKMTAPAITQNEVVSSLVIKDHNNNILYFFERERNDETVNRDKKIFHKGKFIGNVELELSRRLYKQDQQNMLIRYAVITLFVIIAVGAVTGFFVRTFLKIPLAGLNDIVNSYAKGRYDSTAEELPYLEFRLFGEVLAQMGRAIKDHQAHLEDLIDVRTVAMEQAEAANSAKSLFLANMSHELRSPLNVIMGYAQLMQKEALSPAEQRVCLATINRHGENLLSLINDVLEISRIEAGRTTLRKSTCDLPALFADLEKAFASSLDAKQLSFEVIGIDDLPRYVTVDETKLRQVLVNILGNGVKFTEKGGVTVRVAVKGEIAGTMRLGVEVHDTGVGIAEDEMDKVFTYFAQTASGRAKQSGTGLGLAISRDYVRTMGGDISVTSQVDKGCTFRFEIDIQRGHRKNVKAQGARQCVMGLQPGQKVPRILVAEDKTDSRILLVKHLQSAGFKVKEAVNGKEAVEMFHQWRPDFIWIDIRMPVMDGREATRRIKKTKAGQSTIVAALTAHALEEEKEQILAAGCDAFVRKPFHEQEIYEVMAKHLGLKYVYADGPDEPDAEEKTNTQVTQQQLADLPADLLPRLHAAAVELDKGRSLKIIEEIKAHDGELAGALKIMVHQLEFRRLVDLSQGGQAKSQEAAYD